MKILEESQAQWSLIAHSLDQDETGSQFRLFVETWVNAAEGFMAEGDSARDALNRALAVAEKELGTLHVDFYHRMLVLIVGMWEHRDELTKGLSQMETKTLQLATMEQISLHQDIAARGV